MGFAAREWLVLAACLLLWFPPWEPAWKLETYVHVYVHVYSSGPMGTRVRYT